MSISCASRRRALNALTYPKNPLDLFEIGVAEGSFRPEFCLVDSSSISLE